jgi:hypothetical protein
MSIPVTVTLGVPDPDAAPLTFTQACDLLRVLLNGTIDEAITPYILQSDVPAVDDQDKVWQRIDDFGRFLGTYKFYNGFWVLPTPPLSCRVGWFDGDPTIGFDASGLGLPGDGPVALDSYGWAIMNGNNNTPNLSDLFLIAGRMDNIGITGWDAATLLWRTNVSGAPENMGGEAESFLNADNTFRPATEAIRAAHYSADGNTRDAAGGIWGKVGDDDTEGDPFDLVPADAGNEEPDSIRNIPPFFSMALIKWIGYPET